MKKITVVSHDTGGAEVLSHWIKHNHADYFFAVEGPAKEIFKKNLVDITFDSLEQSITNSHKVYVTTSWGSNLELEATKMALDKGIEVICFFDHWTDYENRFFLDDVQYLPNSIWVGDKYAETLVKYHYPKINIIRGVNFYLESIKNYVINQKINNVITKSSDKLKVLYIADNIEDACLASFGDPSYLGYNECEAFEFFMDNINLLEKQIDSIYLRPHPSDNVSKYQIIISKYKNVLIEKSGKEIKEIINQYDVVVGTESMGMIVGILANKKVYSCIPPKGKQCRLPHDEIIHLRNFL